VTKVTGGPPVRGALQELADELLSCKETLSAKGCLSEVDNQDTLRKIIERHSTYLQARFKREARVTHEKHQHNPVFDEIVSFVAEAAAEANDPVYGNLASSYEHKTSVTHPSRPLPRQPVVAQRTNAVSAVTAIADRGDRRHLIQSASNTSTRCMVCGAWHGLFTCQVQVTQRQHPQVMF